MRYFQITHNYTKKLKSKTITQHRSLIRATPRNTSIYIYKAGVIKWTRTMPQQGNIVFQTIIQRAYQSPDPTVFLFFCHGLRPAPKIVCGLVTRYICLRSPPYINQFQVHSQFTMRESGLYVIYGTPEGGWRMRVVVLLCVKCCF